LHGVISGMTAGDAYATESSQEIGMKRRDHVLHTLLSGFSSSAQHTLAGRTIKGLWLNNSSPDLKKLTKP